MIYRFVVDDTIEEKIYHRQIFKKFMADKILQDPSKQRLFERTTMDDLFELPQKTRNEAKSQQKNGSQFPKRHLAPESILNKEIEVKNESGISTSSKRFKSDKT